MNQPNPNHQEEWLKVLGKGMVTLPKRWRDEMDLKEGDVVKAKKEGNKVVLESSTVSFAPYRVYSDDEIEEFLVEDSLPSTLAKRVKDSLTSS